MQAADVLLNQLELEPLFEVISQEYKHLSEEERMAYEMLGLPGPNGDITSGHSRLRLLGPSWDADQDIDAPLDDFPNAALGLMFMIARVSFRDALPADSSAQGFQQQDDFTVADFLSCLKFVRGELHFFAHCIRGRLLMTRITIDQAGTVVIGTVYRGTLLSSWVEMLVKMRADKQDAIKRLSET